MDTMKDTKMQPATDAVIEEQLLELPFDTVMTVTEVIAKLRQFNEWRRCDYGPAEQPEPPNPYEVGLAIDAAVEIIDRLYAKGWDPAMQDALMKFDPATGEERPYPSHATQWRNWHGTAAWLFDPWTGKRRNAYDVGSDVHGLLIAPAGTLGMDMGGGCATTTPTSLNLYAIPGAQTQGEEK